MQDLLKQETVALSDLYSAASEDGIEVYGFALPITKAVSVMDAHGGCAIGIDNSRRYSEAEERTMLMHELGHCKTGAFYNSHSPFSLVEKCERTAENWAIRNYIPYDSLIIAYASGLTQVFELADHFGVSEQFMKKAIEYYLEEKGNNGVF